MTDAAAKRAVVIDDEPDLTAYIESILVEHGFEVRTANDATSGEKLIREDPPDLICLDLMMPGRSGTHLFVRLKRARGIRREAHRSGSFDAGGRGRARARPGGCPAGLTEGDVRSGSRT